MNDKELLGRLKPRHLKMLPLIARGFTDFEMSHELGVSHTTIGKYMRELRWELNLSHRVSLAVFAIRNKLVCLEDLELK